MNPHGERERTTSFPGPNAGSRPQPYKFTHEELKILRECSRESFYQRCLPLSAVLGGATYFAIKTGRLPGSPRFGAVPKVTFAVLVGYFLGKYSYHQKCTEKFMALPNSKVGEMLRARRYGITQENKDPGMPGMVFSPFSSFTDTYSDIKEPNRDIDYDSRPQPEGLDDSFRPSVDNPIILQEEEMPPEQKHVTTYEELRRKNREEYEQKRLFNYREPPKSATPPLQRQPPRDPESIDDYKAPSDVKNKYGDIWG